MRKLSTIHLKDAEVLNDTQLKQICGGSGADSSQCITKCEYSITRVSALGAVVSIQHFETTVEILCSGHCYVKPNVGVSCIDTAVWKFCPENETRQESSGVIF